jgi:pimeloyl-ACP methyl ester carboxylesterase
MVNIPQLPGWLARQYPFKPASFITVHGARLSYLDEGPRRDEAVLLLHGNPTWSFYYRDLIRELTGAGLRCIAPDHIGMGLSEKPQDYPYTLATRIADVEALVASLGLKRVHLVVHDWGGAIGFGFAVRHPEMIGRLVILNTAAFTSHLMPFRIALCGWPGIGPLIVRGFNGFAKPAATMAMCRRTLSEDEKRGYLFPYDSWANRVAVSAFVRDIPQNESHPSWTTLAAVEQGMGQFRNHPALIVWGGRDFCFNDQFLARWQGMLADLQCVRISDAGHYVLEDAAPQAIPLIKAHLLKT